MTKRTRIASTSCLLALVWLVAGARAPAIGAARAAPVGHVFLIVLENAAYQTSFGPNSPAPYLAKVLRMRGALLSRYYGIGHYSLDNYIAMISGQAPNPDTQNDCAVYRNFVASGPAGAHGQLPGSGCVYPANVPTLADQLDAKGLAWKAYMEDMGKDPAREARACGHVALGTVDVTEQASPKDQYADKHDPFVYFHAIIDDAARCDAHVVNLDVLPKDLERISSTPQFVFITPNLCHDGHDAPCADGEPGGLLSVDRFLKLWVPRIRESAAFRKDGLLVITFDEGLDGDACCAEEGLPGGAPAGYFGAGGGRVGALLLSPFIRRGTVSNRPYNHYSLLRSVEGYFGLEPLGYAGAASVKSFGPDVFKRP